jgi:hypothetical protein
MILKSIYCDTFKLLAVLASEKASHQRNTQYEALLSAN